MSKLNELIQELCPNGVEYKLLKEVAILQRGTSLVKNNAVFGEIPVISGGKEPAFYCATFNREGETITVAGSGAGAGYVQYWNIPIYVNDAFSVKGTDIVLTKYVYYFLANNQERIYRKKKGVGVPHVHISDIEEFKIPVPPLEVQREIVRILDNYTEQVEQLKSELNAELDARKKQYEYYRDMLLEFDIESKKVKLGELCDIGDGLHSTPKYDDFGDYYFINGTNLNDGKIIVESKTKKVNEAEYNKYKIELDKNTILMSINGTIGKIAFYNDEPVILGKSIAYFRVNSMELQPKYLYYYLQGNLATKYYNENLTGSTILNLGLKALREFEISLPSLDVQERLVNVLDNFDAICSDLNIGLPAEIEARQKQYEYYRDKLLTFEEIKIHANH